MSRKRLHLTFPENLITQPVIYNIGKEFNVVTNIRRANIEETIGWVILELEGDENEIAKVVEWLGDLGVQVGEIDGNVLEG